MLKKHKARCANCAYGINASIAVDLHPVRQNGNGSTSVMLNSFAPQK